MLISTIRPMNEGRLQNSLFGLRTPGRPGLQLGSIHPSQNERRVTAHQNHTGDRWRSPRTQPSTLIEPFSAREQTAMSYKVSSQFRFELASGFKSPDNLGRSKPNHFEVEKVEVANPRSTAGDFFHRTQPVETSSARLFTVLGRR